LLDASNVPRPEAKGLTKEGSMTRKQSGDRKRYEVLSRMLTDRQDEIRNKLRSLREALPAEVSDVKDTEEQSMEDFVRGMDYALMEMESETLRRIDEAMLRLDGGTYGLCSDCGGRIAEARLEALPFAVTCRDCQEQEEGQTAARAAGDPPREIETRGRAVNREAHRSVGLPMSWRGAVAQRSARARD
jgi:RNA polymerase-binding transcription factor